MAHDHRTILAVLVTAALFSAALGCAGVVSEPVSVVKADQADVVATPNWAVDGVNVDSSCSTLFDACVHAACAVRSLDDKPSNGVVVLRLEQGGSTSKRETVSLGAKESRQVNADFKEAKALGGTAIGRCEIEHTGTRITCTVSNTGKTDHEVTVTARVENGGAKVSEKRETVKLAAGESKATPFEFDKVGDSGKCSVQ